MQTISKTDRIADLQFSTCFTRITLFLSDLLQGLTALDYRNVHTSSLNKSVSFELCKQKFLHWQSFYLSQLTCLSLKTQDVLYFSRWVVKADCAEMLISNEQKEKWNQNSWREFEVLMYCDLLKYS